MSMSKCHQSMFQRAAEFCFGGVRLYNDVSWHIMCHRLMYQREVVYYTAMCQMVIELPGSIPLRVVIYNRVTDRQFISTNLFFLYEWVSEWVSEWLNVWVRNWVFEWVFEREDWVSGWVGERVSEWVSQSVSDWLIYWLNNWVTE